MMKMKIIENALDNFIEMTKNSWTYERMTPKEKERLIDMFCDIRTRKALKGTYDHRWDILQALYNAYLQGIGYNGGNWREER